MEKLAQVLDGLMILFCAIATMWVSLKLLFSMLYSTIGG